MLKKLLSLSLALLLCASSAFAVSDSSDYYKSYNPVFDDSSGDFRDSFLNPVSPAASTVVGWADTDRTLLKSIERALTTVAPGTLLSYVDSIFSDVKTLLGKVTDIRSDTEYLANINYNSNHILSALEGLTSGGLATEATLKTGLLMDSGYPRLARLDDQLSWLLPRISNYLSSDGFNPDAPHNPTLYHYVKNLSETLASDDDKKLAESQKANREQIEKDFVSGSSGQTSLGPSDFGDLSTVGGTIKDSISLNGQSSVSGFTSGLSDADKEGQGWFSASTRDALDAVSSSDSSLSRAPARDSDPYNMRGFSEHYAWLYGG
jgi:hypothetical protein